MNGSQFSEVSDLSQQVWILQGQTLVIVPWSDSVAPSEWSSCVCSLNVWLYKEEENVTPAWEKLVLSSMEEAERVEKSACRALQACSMEEEWLGRPDFMLSQQD